ncbi:ankyrin repeat domain-containing protein 29-like [Homarus americanus]|uniref:ankyrin repeat domain-containing protein 29-like n=1 Tax=Homarus americanus TaxID=6706 RepID=UPI001C445EC7|nr:ankyrin repeat domain-containing protein 29-like [Homarus americanus]
MSQLVRMKIKLTTTGHKALPDGRNSLHLAAEDGNKQKVKNLLKAGARVNSLDHQGFTALHLAAWGGHEEVITVLLKQNADQEILAQGRRAFHWAAVGGHVPAMRELDRYDRQSKFSLTEHHKTALHLAADHGNLEAVNWLLKHGVDLELEDENGLTAEDYARDEGILLWSPT